MKIKIFRALLRSRAYANTAQGERVFIRTLTTLTAILFADVLLLAVGVLLH